VDRLLIACDFDGTITERDTLHVIVEEFGTRGLWGAIEPRLRAGEVTLEQAMQ
jgi:2-hydroxy-3-keto-5-methylthiopentenyl-1-phosphate phosphatase